MKGGCDDVVMYVFAGEEVLDGGGVVGASEDSSLFSVHDSS